MALELNQFLFVRGLRPSRWGDIPMWVRQLQNVRWFDTPAGDLDDISDFLPVEPHRPTLHDVVVDSDAIGKRVLKRSNKCVYLRSDMKHLDDRGNLHHDSDFAYASGAIQLYFLHGIHIERQYEHLVKAQRNSIDSKEVLAIENVDVRRELIRKVGIELFIDHLYHKVIDRHGNYELIEVLLSDNTWSRARFLKMLNPSIGVWHLEGVPNESATVEDALRRRNNNWFAHPDILT